MSSYSQEYIEKIYDLLTEAEVELSPAHYRTVLEKAIEEVENRLSDFINYVESDDDYEE